MIDYKPQLEAAEKLANVVDKLLREKVSLSEVTTALMEFRTAQILADEELSKMFEQMQKNIKPELDYEEKRAYDLINNQPKDSKGAKDGI